LGRITFQRLHEIGRFGYLAEASMKTSMAATISASLQKKAASRITALIGQTLEEEVFSLYSVSPEAVARIPSLFSESVVDTITSILGDDPGEALIRSIGDENLHEPSFVYSKLDSVLQDGSEILKAAIREEFRVKVHQLYEIVLGMAPPAHREPL
jgi:hypothetical protein